MIMLKLKKEYNNVKLNDYIDGYQMSINMVAIIDEAKKNYGYTVCGELKEGVSYYFHRKSVRTGRLIGWYLPICMFEEVR